MSAESENDRSNAALAVGAHPDDIEYQMAGTLLQLKAAGWEIHYMNLSSGNCGSVEHDSMTTRSVRWREAQEAAGILGAIYHTSLTDDLEIFYEIETLRRLAAVIREIAPAIILTHPPQDYMEDHTNTCRLVVTAAFARGIPNFKTHPARPVTRRDVAIYHAMPHGLRDGLRRRVRPGAFVNTTAVHETKKAALTAHKSQQQWLEVSQGMNSFLQTMEAMSREIGRMSGKFEFAEGWRRHLHFGFSNAEIDPLAGALGEDYLLNQAHERALNRGA